MLLTAKLWLRSCNSLAPLKKLPWQEKPINVKKIKSFPVVITQTKDHNSAVNGPIQNL